MGINRFTLMMWLLLLGGDAFSEPNNTLNLYTEEFPPYNYRDGEKIVGINHDIVMAMCERADIKCNVTLLPWSRAIRRAQTEVNAGIYSTARREDRELDWQWVGPLLSSHNCLYKSDTRTDVVINTQEDLSKYRLGVPKTFAYPEKLTELGFIENINQINFRDLKTLMAGVEHDRVDLMLGSVNTMALQARQLNKTVNEFTPVWKLELSEDIGNYLALNKGVALDIIARLNASFKTMQELHVLDDIKQRYVDTSASDNMQAPAELKACAEFPILSL